MEHRHDSGTSYVAAINPRTPWTGRPQCGRNPETASIPAGGLPPASRAWIRTLSSQFWEVDGNPNLFTEGHIEMARNHILGSLFNHSIRRQNCSFETEEWRSDDLKSFDCQVYSKCIFIRATRDIYPNEQLLDSYGASADSFQHIPF